jgi:hypothetical protein
MHDENLSTEENKLLWRSRLHPDDSDRIIKSIDSCSGPQIHGQMSFAFKIRWLMVILRTRDYYKDDQKLRFIGSMLDVTDLKKPKKNSRMRIRWRQ